MYRAFGLLVLLAGSMGAVPPEYRVDWPALERAYAAFLEQPGPATSQAIERLLPPGSADRHVGVFDVAAALRIFGQLDALEAMTKRGQPDAVQVALVLLSISDGHYTEELLTMIAGSIDAEPAVFLQTLKRNPDRPFATCELATDTGLDYVDDPKGELVVLEQRLKKVERIKRPELEAVKQCVLKSLRDTVDVMKEHVK